MATELTSSVQSLTLELIHSVSKDFSPMKPPKNLLPCSVLEVRSFSTQKWAASDVSISFAIRIVLDYSG